VGTASELHLHQPQALLFNFALRLKWCEVHSIHAVLILLVPFSNFIQSLDQIALFLGALTAGGGITGYIRTGSIPSVVAGVTVGALVRSLLLIHPSLFLLM